MALNMGGQQAGGEGNAIPKDQFLQIIAEFRQRALAGLLAAKKQNIQERMAHYHQNLELYKAAVMGFVQKQQAVMSESAMAVLEPRGFSAQDLNQSMTRYMGDQDVQPSLVALQTLTGDFCEGQPVPESLTRDNFLAAVRLQTSELRKYPINNMLDSMLAQVAAADEVFQRMGYDEITMAAAAIQFEDLVDPELAHAREEFNEAAKMEEMMRRPPPQPAGGHQHGPNCDHGHQHKSD